MPFSERKMRTGLVIGGAITFGAMYVFAAVVGTIFQRSADAEGDNGNPSYVPLYIPAVGPFIAIGTAHADGLFAVFFVSDGIVQLSGIAMIIAGFAAPRSELVRNNVGKLDIHFTPMMVGRDIRGTSTMGFGLVGSM